MAQLVPDKWLTPHRNRGSAAQEYSVINYSNASTGKGAIEIGAGTGKATHPFLDAGYDVTAIEIGSNMADFLLKRFSGHKGLNVVVSSFEDAVLQESSYDLYILRQLFIG